MNFFFDNNLSPHIAHAMRELSSRLEGVEEVRHLRDLFPGDTNDLVWISSLGESGAWCVLSVDRFKKQGEAEREALRRAGHTVFFLEPQWLKQDFWLQAERMVRWWPQIVQQARLVERGAFTVPWKHSAAAKFRAVRL